MAGGDAARSIPGRAARVLQLSAHDCGVCCVFLCCYHYEVFFGYLALPVVLNVAVVVVVVVVVVVFAAFAVVAVFAVVAFLVARSLQIQILQHLTRSVAHHTAWYCSFDRHLWC